MNNLHYQTVAHLDAPIRFLTLTVDEVVIAFIAFLILAISNQKILTTIVGLGLVSALRFFKNGGGPKVLLRLSYWHLPHYSMQFFLPKLPASYRRIWRK